VELIDQRELEEVMNQRAATQGLRDDFVVGAVDI